MKKLLFPGSFNPFTIGHEAIVERGLKLAETIVIAIGYNEKKNIKNIEPALEEIRRYYAGNNRIEVTTYNGLTADFAKEIGADAILRAVRNFTDFEYEKNLAEINRSILGVETIILIADPQMSIISSSAVRELKANGYDVTKFLPNN